MKKSPLWMAVYVAQFLGETAHMTCEQLGAYVRLKLTLWLHGGSLANDETALRRIAHVHAPRWRNVWGAIKGMFNVEGDTVTHDTVTEELTKARVIIETRRAAGAIGGGTTRDRYSRRRGYDEHMAAPKPLKVIHGGAAYAPHNHNHSNKKEEERGNEPLPFEGKAPSPLKEEASRERGDPAKPPEAERERQVAEWEARKRKIRGA
jgi:uncharacterized protein YdaU (DUF1376 family)